MESFAKTLIVVALMASLATVAMGQMPACASKLIPCKDYLNTTSPPKSCCDPMRDAVKNELSCLCDLFKQSDLFKAFNINVTQAIELPEHCGIKEGIGACKTANAPAPTAGAPPSTPGGENNAGRAGLAGVSTLTGLVFLWASMVIRA